MSKSETSSSLQTIFSTPKPLIGMVHLPPLPGSPRYAGNGISMALDTASRDAKTLEDGGIDGLLIENYGDLPFKPTPSDPETVASMTAIGLEISRTVSIPIGVNVLRNGALAAMAIAHAIKARFVRVNVFIEALMTDQGVIEACAHDLIRYRKLLQAEDVQVFADVRSKHAAPLVSRPLEQSARDTAYRGLADALVVSGARTGEEPDEAQLRLVKQSVPDRPILIGSGLTIQNAVKLLGIADGGIVGTAIKTHGTIDEPVEMTRVKELIKSIEKLR